MLEKHNPSEKPYSMKEFVSDNCTQSNQCSSQSRNVTWAHSVPGGCKGLDGEKPVTAQPYRDGVVVGFGFWSQDNWNLGEVNTVPQISGALPPFPVESIITMVRSRHLDFLTYPTITQHPLKVMNISAI